MCFLQEAYVSLYFYEMIDYATYIPCHQVKWLRGCMLNMSEFAGQLYTIMGGVDKT